MTDKEEFPGLNPEHMAHLRKAEGALVEAEGIVIRAEEALLNPPRVPGAGERPRGVQAEADAFVGMIRRMRSRRYQSIHADRYLEDKARLEEKQNG